MEVSTVRFYRLRSSEQKPRFDPADTQIDILEGSLLEETDTGFRYEYVLGIGWRRIVNRQEVLLESLIAAVQEQTKQQQEHHAEVIAALS